MLYFVDVTRELLMSWLTEGTPISARCTKGLPDGAYLVDAELDRETGRHVRLWFEVPGEDGPDTPFTPEYESVEVIPIQSIARLQLKPNDTLVIKTRRRVSRACLDLMHADLAEHGIHHVMVIDDDVELSVIERPEIAADTSTVPIDERVTWALTELDQISQGVADSDEVSLQMVSDLVMDLAKRCGVRPGCDPGPEGPLGPEGA